MGAVKRSKLGKFDDNLPFGTIEKVRISELFCHLGVVRFLKAVLEFQGNPITFSTTVL